MIDGVSKNDFWLIWSVLHNACGYPMSESNPFIKAFNRVLAGNLREKIFSSDEKNLILDEHEQKLILKSFQVFLSEPKIDENESFAITDHYRSEVEALYEKLKLIYTQD